MPLAPVTAVTSYRLGDAMHRLLRGYKDASLSDVRSDYTAQLAHMVTRWMCQNRDHLLARTQGPWDIVVGVPSSKRPAGSPVDALVDAVPLLAPCHRALLARGAEPTDHLVASPRGFVVETSSGKARVPFCGTVRSLRALVFDDSFITGARAQSAVGALRSAGLRVAGVLVVGRVVAPQSAPWQAAYWESRNDQQLDLGGAVGISPPGRRFPVRTY